MKKKLLLFGLCILVSLQVVDATSFTELWDDGVTQSSGGSSTYCYGVRFLTLQNSTLNWAKYSDNAAADKTIRIYNDSGNLLESASMSTRNGTFTGGYELEEGVYYRLCAGGGTTISQYSSYDFSGNETESINIIEGAGPTAEYSGKLYNIEQISLSVESSSANFSITANDIYAGGSINSFSADINDTIYSTTTGTIITDINESGNATITVFADGYFNSTYEGWNTSTDLTANLTINHTVLNVSAYDYLDSIISDFTATAESLNSSHTISENTTSGSLTIDLNWNETYNVSVSATNYSTYNNSDTINMDNYSEYLNITGLRETNTINITFKYDNSTSADDITIDVDLIGDTLSKNYSTSNGSLYLTLLSPEDYLITYEATGFPLKTYAFTLTNRSYNELTLYLSGDYSNITATVYDESGEELEGATIKVLKYDISTNSYIEVQQANTNFEGKTILYLKKNTVYYKFAIKYDDELKPIIPSEETFTSPTYIFSDSLSFQIQTTESVADNYFTVSKINGELSFNNETDNFRFDFSDSDGITTRACVYVTKITDLKTTNYDSSCLSASSGTVLVGVDRINGTSYKATAYVYPGGTETFFDNLIITFREFYDTGKYGLFLIGLVTIVFAFVSKGSPLAAIILTPVPLLVAAYIGFVSPDLLSIMILVEIGALILAFLIKDRV